jgi:sugar phosphate isomerase/epimerase
MAPIPVGLATGSVFPESADRAFRLAWELGYDGVEVMVGLDRISQDVDALADLVQRHGVPVLSIHAPCLIITQRVWGADPWGKLVRSRDAAIRLGADVVVVHPPFVWQRSYARDFVAGLDRIFGGDPPLVDVAVENMFPLSAIGRPVSSYRPSWRVDGPDGSLYRHVTLDVSHTVASGDDARDVLRSVGPALRHVHLADGVGNPAVGGSGSRDPADSRPSKDEHLIPGRGTAPCAEVLRTLASTGYTGSVIVEVTTRRVPDAGTREADLGEALAFARRHLRP